MHIGGSVALGRAVRLRDLRVDNQTMPVIGQHMAQIAKHRAGAAALTKQVRFAVRARFMRLVAAILAVPVLELATAAFGRCVVVGLVFAHEALVSRPSLNQRAVHAEMLAREVATRVRGLNRFVKQTDDDVMNQQAVAVLAEGRVVPHPVFVNVVVASL